jgi:Transcription elongation factor
LIFYLTRWGIVPQWGVCPHQLCRLLAETRRIRRDYLAWIMPLHRIEKIRTMEDRILITTNDYQRLTGLMGFSSLTEKMPEIVNQLNNKFKTAKMLSQENMSADVITMNSRVLLKEVTRGRQAEVTITYPQDADGKEGKISVFSPIGSALLGRRVGDKVSWKVPHGVGHFEVVKILYQPEAVGHYHL